MVVEEHTEALAVIHRATRRRLLPLRDVAMLHFDSHPDLVVSPTLPSAPSPARVPPPRARALSLYHGYLPRLPEHFLHTANTTINPKRPHPPLLSPHPTCCMNPSIPIPIAP